MAVSITSFTPNTKIQSAQVNTNFTNVKSGVEDTSYRAFTWYIPGTLSTGNEQGSKIIVPQNVTIKKLWYKTTSGTATLRLQKDTTDIVSGESVTSTVASTTTFNAAVTTAGQVLTLDLTAASGTDLLVTLEAQVTSIA